MRRKAMVSDLQRSKPTYPPHCGYLTRAANPPPWLAQGSRLPSENRKTLRLSALALRPRVAVHGLDQCGHMRRRRELADSVAQVEDMRRPGGAAVGVGRAKAVEHLLHLLHDARRRGQQHMGVDVALQRLARAAHGAA